MKTATLKYNPLAPTDIYFHMYIHIVVQIQTVEFLFKEQSPSPRVLLAQTKPEGLPEGFAAKKTRGQGDCSYYNTTHVTCAFVYILFLL